MNDRTTKSMARRLELEGRITPITDQAYADRVELFTEMQNQLGPDFYNKLGLIFNHHLGSKQFNEWHTDNWPHTCMAACRGDTILVLLRMKAIQLREAGLL